MTATVVLINVVGWAGMVLLVSAYGLVTAGRLRATGVAFQLMNLVGGFFLMLNTGYYRAWPSTALNLVWLVVGVFGLVRWRRSRHATPPAAATAPPPAPSAGAAP